MDGQEMKRYFIIYINNNVINDITQNIINIINDTTCIGQSIIVIINHGNSTRDHEARQKRHLRTLDALRGPIG